jgi:hypothetical protein
MLAPLHKVVFLSYPAGAYPTTGPEFLDPDLPRRLSSFFRGVRFPVRIVTNIWNTYALNIMKIHGYHVLIAVLVLFLALAAGCTTPQQTPSAATQVPAGGVPAATAQATYQAPAATHAASTADIDTTIRVRFNDLACVNVGDYLGVTYLYPDQTYKLEAASPGANTINVNVLFVDENDQLALRQAKPQWDVVKKSWRYESVVPLVQFNDITTPVEKTFTIKRQSKYYICADDRKESGTQDITYLVPVKLTRL